MKLQLTVNGSVYDVEVEVEEEPLPTLGAVLVGSTSAYTITPTATKAPATSANALTSPVSGTVVTVLVEAGAEVKSPGIDVGAGHHCLVVRRSQAGASEQ